MGELLTTLRRKAEQLISGRASVHRGTEPDADDAAGREDKTW
jgi:hypothetical protein